MGTNRRLIIRVLRRGGVDHDATLVAHARTVLGAMLSARLQNTIRVTIKLRAGLAKDRHGECHFRDMSKAVTARSKHYTIVLRRDRDLAGQLSTLTHELKHLEQMARGRLAIRRTYGTLGYFWRAPGLAGCSVKYEIRNGDCVMPWSHRPWEIEAIQASVDFSHLVRPALLAVTS